MTTTKPGEEGGDREPTPRPTIRHEPEDFVVEEELLFPLDDDGQHTYLWIEKRMRNTDEVARQLARLARVPLDRVGYAGRKDRRAVARQWFSVPRLDPGRAADLELDGARVLLARRHRDKLQLGELSGNRFEVRVRDASAGDLSAAQQRLAELVDHGLPNRFGEQRFGRHGDNAALGARLLAGERLGVDRRQAQFYLSALQSAVFNEVLSRRPLPLGRLITGDLAWVHHSGGLYSVADAAAEQPRADRFEVSPTGPLFGTRVRHPGERPLAIEQEVLRQLGLPEEELLVLPRGLRLAGDRRPLRVPLGEPLLGATGDGFWLRVSLPPGSYATVLLSELLPGGYAEGGGERD